MTRIQKQSNLVEISNQNSLKIAIISSKGGSGHLIAAQAAKAQFGGRCYEMDTFATLGKIGKACTNSWDKAQKNGDVKKQIQLARKQGLAEVLFGVPIYFKVCYILLRHNIDQVVDTQAIGTVSIVRAARTVNFIYKVLRKKNKSITVWKIFIELPNSKSLYYHRYVKKLSENDKKLFRFVSTKPLFKTFEEEEAFWQKFCKLSVIKGEVVYAESPIRKEFLDLKNTRPPKPQELSIAINTEEELTILQSLHPEFALDTKLESAKSFQIPLKEEDIVMTLMLGSQVAENATLSYVSKLLALQEKAKKQNKKIYFFVFCNKHIPQKQTLFKKVADLVCAKQGENPNIKVIPLTFQNASEIAPMLYRSDVAITRTGAQASHEAKNIVQKQILIHSEKSDENLELSHQDQLLEGIPLWEGGNAQFLIENHQAKIVNPHLFQMFVDRHFNFSEEQHDGLQSMLLEDA